MPIHSSHTASPRPLLKRPSTLIAGVIALGVLLGTGVTAQVAADEAQRAAIAQETAERLEEHRQTAVAGASAARLEFEAESTIDAAAPVIASAAGKVDASALTASVTALSDYASLEPHDIVELLGDVEEGLPTVQAAVAEADRVAAEEAAVLRTPAGAQAYARQLMASQYGWGAGEASCLVSLWQKESGWNYQALNASSGATGIPQSLPGSKMATHGADWRSNPATQISWGLDYIKRAYGTPCGAWGKSQAVGWY